MLESQIKRRPSPPKNVLTRSGLGGGWYGGVTGGSRSRNCVVNMLADTGGVCISFPFPVSQYIWKPST